MQLTIDKFSAVNQLKEEFTSTVNDIHEELNGHLDTINENSLELQSHFDYLEELSQKIDKLSIRMDEVCDMVLKSQDPQPNSNDVSILKCANLNPKEKDIFLVLYTSNEPLSFEEIAARADYPIYLVEDIVESLEKKNIPLVRKFFAGKALMLLDEDFKKKQAQTGIVKLRN